jgi:hypothetical protein
MSHFVVFPLTEDGTFYNPALVGQALDDAMSRNFSFENVFIYSHGWSTTGNDAMAEYGQYTVGFSKNLLGILNNNVPNSFGIGIHWPSTLSEDKVSVTSAFQALSFYQMGSRANQVGANGVFEMLRRMLRARQANGDAQPFKNLTLTGHSFGCRVVCRALQTLYQDMKKAGTLANNVYTRFVEETEIRVVLLQAAFDQNELDIGGKYDALSNFPKLKILVTISDEDTALNNAYPNAEKLSNIAHLNLNDIPVSALGAGLSVDPKGGPTQGTATQYEAMPVLPVHVGFKHSDVPKLEQARMLVADLTSLHGTRHNSGAYAGWSASSGSHSDISNQEIYNLITGFILQ